MIEIPFDISYRIGEDLRDVPNDAAQMRYALLWLRAKLEEATDGHQQIELLGLIGSYARLLGELAIAQRYIALAIKKAQLIRDIRLETVNRIRLAHIYHWQENYTESEALFDRAISACQNTPELQDYLDFAYQHLGKCKFDQQQYNAALFYFKSALALRIDKKNQFLISSTQYAIERAMRVLQATT